MQRKLSIYWTIVNLIIGTSFLRGAEKVGTTSFQFLKLAPDARSAAMGNAITSVINTSEAGFWNPAALRKISGLDFSVSYIDYFLDVSISSFALSVPLGGTNTIGLHGMLVNYGEIEVTDVAHQGWNDDYTRFNPGLTGEVLNPGARVLGFSYARSITDKFNFGLTANYIVEDLILKKGTSFSFDGGLTYHTGWRSLTMAASVRNFGPEVTFINESYPIPETFTFGISGYLFSPTSALFTLTGNHHLLLSYDLTHPRDYDQQHNFGAEYSFMDFMFLRGGYKFNYDEEGLALGAGLRIKNIRLDYAFDPFGEILQSVHRFSIGFGLQ